MFENRIRNSELLKKVVSPEDAAMLIKDGMNVAASGFTLSGYPKAVSMALARKVRENNEKLKINLLTGASVGDEFDGELARAGVIARRLPYQTNDSLRNSINKGECDYLDMHLSQFPQYIRYGFLGKIDIAIIEAAAITEDGDIIPTTSVGCSPTFVSSAEKVIVEINTSQPIELEGMADIFTPKNPPNREPIMLSRVNQRIGTTHIAGSRMMNGIGGSGDFTRNAYISIFTTTSTAKDGHISSIVPMVSHHDHTEHDAMIIVTENGLADLRGLSPKERARLIINNCAHPDYRPMLLDYFKRAQKINMMHTPHLLNEALSWHTRYIETGTMNTAPLKHKKRSDA